MSEEKKIEQHDNNDKPVIGNRHPDSDREANPESQQATSNQSAPSEELTTENMEVHKHPHHVTHKKKWGEYVLEFLMLFLAVFLGFVAENFREHQVEKRRGREYIHSFHEDLKYDISRMDGIIDTESVKIAALSKMAACYDSIKQKWSSTSCLLSLLTYSRSNNNFQITNRTLNQLGNAGGFRLLKTQDADSIVGYQNDVNNLRDFESTLYQQAQDNVRNTSMELLEFSANIRLYSNIIVDPGAFNPNVNTPLLLSDNKEILNKNFNELLQYEKAIARHRLMLIALKDRAASIGEYLNHNYHLE